MESFLCPITHEAMSSPVVAQDGHTYEEWAIRKWLQRHDTSPVTGLRLEETSLRANFALRNAQQEYEEQVETILVVEVQNDEPVLGLAKGQLVSSTNWFQRGAQTFCLPEGSKVWLCWDTDVGGGESESESQSLEAKDSETDSDSKSDDFKVKVKVMPLMKTTLSCKVLAPSVRLHVWPSEADTDSPLYLPKHAIFRPSCYVRRNGTTYLRVAPGGRWVRHTDDLSTL